MPRLRFSISLFFVSALVLFHAVPQLKAEQNSKKHCLGGACFAAEHKIGDLTLPLKGVSLFEYWSFDVYSAALYAPDEVKDIDGVLGDVPKYLVLEYHRGLEKQNIVDNSEYILKENPKNDMQTLRERLKVLYENYNDVKDGDRFSMSYIPGKGTTLFYNGTEKKTLPGVDFQQAYFGIWLSRASVDEDFTEELLGLKD